jgi:hypothetical protein
VTTNPMSAITGEIGDVSPTTRIVSRLPDHTPQNLALDAKANTSDILVSRLFLTNIWNSVGFGDELAGTHHAERFGGARS